MSTYTQPTLLDPPRPATWAEAINALTAAGLRLERQPRPRAGSMRNHRGEWWAARKSADGTYVWVQVLNWRGILRWNWQVTAYRRRPVGSDPDGPSHEDVRVLLHDPTVEEALAAIALFGLGGDSDER
jgi:hypothetical protein